MINLVRSLPHYLSIIDITDTCCPVVRLTRLSGTMETRRRNHHLQKIAPCTLVFLSLDRPPFEPLRFTTLISGAKAKNLKTIPRSCDTQFIKFSLKFVPCSNRSQFNFVNRRDSSCQCNITNRKRSRDTNDS